MRVVRNRIVAAASMLVVSSSCFARNSLDTPWDDFSKVFSCTPHRVATGDKILLRMASGAGKELGGVDPKGRWFFLVVEGSYDGMKQLMSSEDLAKRKTVSLDTRNLTGLFGNEQMAEDAWYRPVEKKVFRVRGTYKFYLSENLESEIGGYTCKVKFIIRKAPPGRKP